MQNLIDPPLLDDAVRRSSGTSADEQIADILEARSVAIDEILRIALLPQSSSDGDLILIEWQEATAIVEQERRFCELRTCATGRTVEDDVGHLLPAETLRALVTENPLDRIHDVALATAVRSDDAGDAGSEVKDRAVGETLEAKEFERLEHGEGESGFRIEDFRSRIEDRGRCVIRDWVLPGCRRAD